MLAGYLQAVELEPTNTGTLTDLGIFLGERRGAVALASKMLRKVLDLLRQQGVDLQKLHQAVSLRVCPHGLSLSLSLQ